MLHVFYTNLYRKNVGIAIDILGENFQRYPTIDSIETGYNIFEPFFPLRIGRSVVKVSCRFNRISTSSKVQFTKRPESRSPFGRY